MVGIKFLELQNKTQALIRQLEFEMIQTLQLLLKLLNHKSHIYGYLITRYW